MPIVLPPTRTDDILVVSLDLPSPTAAVATMICICGGVGSCDFFKMFMDEELPWSPEFASPRVLGHHLLYGDSGERESDFSETEIKERVGDILNVMEGLVRLSFNFCKLGFYDTAVLEFMDVFYSGCMDALLQIGLPISLSSICEHDELLRLMRSNRTLLELYMRAIGCGA
jgi:hypothetical protein